MEKNHIYSNFSFFYVPFDRDTKHHKNTMFRSEIRNIKKYHQFLYIPFDRDNEPYDTHVQKQSLYKMYDATVGAIDEKRFNKMLKQCDKIIARGLYGKKLFSRAGNWVDVDSKEKRTVVKNIRLKLNH